MKVTYIGHSGFLVELEETYLLFDYFEGNIPTLDETKKLIIFVSHNHHDHFNPKIFDIKHDDISYILSSDVRIQKTVQDKELIIMEPHEKINISIRNNQDINVETLKSTDEGIAFLVCVEGKNIYHAGDLNLWKWKEEDDTYNDDMSLNYSKEIDQLVGKKIDVAFLPLDPRQEEYAYEGVEEFIQKVNADIIFPMHFWKDYSIIERYNESHELKVSDVNRIGQTFKINENEDA